MTETQSGPGPARGLGGWLKILAIGSNPKKTLVRAFVLAVVCVVVFNWVLLPVRVEGISMEPTYSNHSVDVINRLPLA